MLAGFARHFSSLSLSKAGYCLGLSSLLLLLGAGSVHDATAENETRTLSFHHTHSDEDLTVTFKREGRYDEQALKQLNHYLRDWRNQDETVMDRHLFDILWEVYRDVDARKPIQIISAYRSPATNAMLRRRSSGVARYSQHMLGHAMDLYIPDVPLEQIRFAGLRLQRGGVGFYPTSGSPFVHLDTGSIRHWPRMNHDQLARVFPDGRTVHVPTDGTPLKGYELARADIERRDGGDGALTRSSPSLWAALFKNRSSDDEDESVAASPSATVQLAAARTAEKSADPVPMPRIKPRSAFQLASADAQIVRAVAPKPAAPAPTETGNAGAPTPADIINARGLWPDTVAKANQATPAQVAAIAAREALAAADTHPAPAVPAASPALAYAPASAVAPASRPTVVAAAAPVPLNLRPAVRNAMAAMPIDTVAIKGPQGPAGPVPTSARISAAKGGDIWLRAMILAPSASLSMASTVLGDTDMTVMRAYFVKPQSAVTMGFSDDPQMGLQCDRFTGSATATLTTISFVLRTASLH